MLGLRQQVADLQAELQSLRKPSSQQDAAVQCSSTSFQAHDVAEVAAAQHVADIEHLSRVLQQRMHNLLDHAQVLDQHAAGHAAQIAAGFAQLANSLDSKLADIAAAARSQAELWESECNAANRERDIAHSELRASHLACDELQEQLASEQAARHCAERSANAAIAELDRCSGSLECKQKELAAASRHAKVCQLRLDAAKEEACELQQRSDLLAEALPAAEARHEATQRALLDLRAEHQASCGQVADLRAQMQRCGQQLATAHAGSEEQRHAAMSLERNMAAQSQQCAQQAAELSASQAALRTCKRQLEAAKHSRTEVSAELQGCRAELEAAQAQLAQAHAQHDRQASDTEAKLAAVKQELVDSQQAAAAAATAQSLALESAKHHKTAQADEQLDLVNARSSSVPDCKAAHARACIGM